MVDEFGRPHGGVDHSEEWDFALLVRFLDFESWRQSEIDVERGCLQRGVLVSAGVDASSDWTLEVHWCLLCRRNRNELIEALDRLGLDTEQQCKQCHLEVLLKSHLRVYTSLLWKRFEAMMNHKYY